MKTPIRLALILLFVLLGAAGNRVQHAAPVRAGEIRDHVRLQLKWVTQAQFAGYYAAEALGFYDAAGLDVEILQGSADVAPEPVVANGNAEFGIDWLPSLLVSREQGMDLVNIAQVFQRSATTEITWKSSGISRFEQLRGKRASVWCCGNQYELYAALRKADIDPSNSSDITLIDQPSDMDLFLNRNVDASAAETYNELAQVLEGTNPSTGGLYTLDDLNVLSMEDAGAGMLQDGVFVSGGWISDPAHQDVAVRFLRASERGWIYCRDHQEACVQVVLANGPTLGAGHQRWMLNEVNALIWPSYGGIGAMDSAAYERTAAIAQDFGDISNPPSGIVYRTDLAAQALAGLEGDIQGLGWQKADVQVTPGGR
jgi:NitT/TauT family transport system substrate-binding protein